MHRIGNRQFLTAGLGLTGLGIGSAMAAMPWVASADTTADAVSSIDLGGLALPDAADSASSFDFSNMALSIDGYSVFEDGTATAIYYYTLRYELPGLTERPQSAAELKKMMFQRIDDQWKIVGGI